MVARPILIEREPCSVENTSQAVFSAVSQGVFGLSSVFSAVCSCSVFNLVFSLAGTPVPKIMQA